jgi:hypothetical protein
MRKWYVSWLLVYHTCAYIWGSNWSNVSFKSRKLTFSDFFHKILRNALLGTAWHAIMHIKVSCLCFLSQIFHSVYWSIVFISVCLVEFKNLLVWQLVRLQCFIQCLQLSFPSITNLFCIFEACNLQLKQNKASRFRGKQTDFCEPCLYLAVSYKCCQNNVSCRHSLENLILCLMFAQVPLPLISVIK